MRTLLAARRLGTAAGLGALAVAGGCGGGDGFDPPARLADGSVPPPVPAALAELEGASMTGVRVVRGLQLEQAPYADCIDRAPGGPPAIAVERVAASGRTLTFATDDRQQVVGCDGAAQAREPSGPWCGLAVADWLAGGRLSDGRLNLANCLSADRSTVAFAWVTPAPRAGWLVVEHDDFREVYEQNGPLPIRVATTDGIDEDTSSVRIPVSSYAEDGTKLADDTVELQVAG